MTATPTITPAVTPAATTAPSNTVPEANPTARRGRGTADGPQVSVFGIRHHGPGSARSLVRALEELKPDLVLIEGPPEADGLVAFVDHEQMRPPVALLAYATGDVRQAAFWPMAAFSPEWCALRYATSAGIPARFCDLPYAYQLNRKSPVDTDPPSDGDAPEAAGAVGPDGTTPAAGPVPGETRRPTDPLALLAEAAGYDDAERWWDDVIEHRRDGVGPFTAIAEAMAAVRADAPPDPDDRDHIREAYMRTVLRAAMKDGHDRIAVVCGAWHVPALTAPLPSAATDAALLKRAQKTAAKKNEVAATWVPWTHGRLASWTGYGAGVTSPGWYHHLFNTTDRVVERWLVAVAGVLRDEDLPVSSAHLIEAVRLAEALAAMRGRPLPGLSEVTEATRAVLCDGDEVRLAMIQRRVVVGERLGEVPPEAPAVPLARDLAATQRRLRLPPEALARTVDLDLRKPNDLARSHLLHRLRLLDLDWATPAEQTGDARTGKGTFWESWRLAWAPEFTIDLIAASAYGTTVAAAATARATESAAGAPDLAAVTTLVERCLLADLGDALPDVLRALDERLARDTDVAHLMDALPPLTRSLRYGDVRGTDTGALGSVVAGLVLRACVGLPPALTGLDDAAATAMRDRLNTVHGALRTLADAALSTRWLDALTPLVDRDDLPGLLAGQLTRLLHDEGRLDLSEVSRRMALTLTVGVPPARAAAWVEGFLAGGGLLLVHDENLLRLVDGWISHIPADNFVEVLPLLRRTFSGFAAPERRSIGEQIRRTASGPNGAPAPPDADEQLDPDRVALILPVLRHLLSVEA